MKHEVTSYNTKRLLAEALKKAMEQKPFSKVTVSELIRECGINRKTFYYHFQDLYALLKWVLDEEAVQIVRHFDLLVDYEEAIRFVMSYVSENRFIRSCTADVAAWEEIKRFFYADFMAMLRSVIEEAEKRSGVEFEMEFKEYAAKFYTEALVGMLIDWAGKGDPNERERVIEYLTTIIGVTVESMLQEMQKRKGI